MLGPLSLAQVNALDAATLLAQYKQMVAQRYKAIAAANTDLAGDLNGWLARLNS